MNEFLNKKLQEAGMTNAQLAQSSGIDEMRIYNFKRGRFLPKPDEAVKIAAVLKVLPGELFPLMADKFLNANSTKSKGA